MARTTEAAVKAKLLLDYDSLRTPSLATFVTAANVLTNQVVVASAMMERGTLGADALLEIETLLACHFYQDSDPAYQSKSTAGSSASFTGTAGMGLDRTRYGQTAMLMDWTRALAAINKGNYASADWLGKTVSEQIPYEQRN